MMNAFRPLRRSRLWSRPRMLVACGLVTVIATCAVIRTASAAPVTVGAVTYEITPEPDQFIKIRSDAIDLSSDFPVGDQSIPPIPPSTTKEDLLLAYADMRTKVSETFGWNLDLPADRQAIRNEVLNLYNKLASFGANFPGDANRAVELADLREATRQISGAANCRDRCTITGRDVLPFVSGVAAVAVINRMAASQTDTPSGIALTTTAHIAVALRYASMLAEYVARLADGGLFQNDELAAATVVITGIGSFVIIRNEIDRIAALAAAPNNTPEKQADEAAKEIQDAAKDASNNDYDLIDGEL